MVFNMFLLVALVALALPGKAIIAGLPYHMQSFNPNSMLDDGTNRGTGNCWTAASNTNGAAVTLQKCQSLGTASQQWTFSAGALNGAIGTIKIFGNKCLDVQDGVDKSGTRLQIWTCTSANKNQQWQVANGDDAPSLTIKWANSTRCIDLTGGSQSNGTPLQIWTCGNGNTHQEWISQYASPTPPSEGSEILLLSSLQPAVSDLLCIHSGAAENNADVAMVSCDVDDFGSHWVWEGGSLKVFGNLCLDVTNGVNANGTPLQTFKCNAGNKNQQWKFNQNYSIQWVGTNKCIDLTDGKLESGTNLQIWTCFDGNTHQEWEISP